MKGDLMEVQILEWARRVIDDQVVWCAGDCEPIGFRIKRENLPCTQQAVFVAYGWDGERWIAISPFDDLAQAQWYLEGFADGMLSMLESCMEEFGQGPKKVQGPPAHVLRLVITDCQEDTK